MVLFFFLLMENLRSPPRRLRGQKGESMSITLKDRQTTLDILDTDALTAYIRDHVQVITAHTETCRGTSGVCLSVVAPPFIRFHDAIHNRVDIVIEIENPRKLRTPA